MKFFKNSELTAKYNVSDKAIRNWIQAAKGGKNELELYVDGKNFYIADSVSNLHVIEHLVKKGRKYRNHRNYHLITPKNDFYQIYTANEIFDIINRLEIDHDLPGQYKYFGDGALYWDKYLNKLNESGTPNLITNTREAIRLNYAYIDGLIDKYKFINVVNLCVGNSLAIKDLLQHLDKNNRLNEIKLIDISNDMLNIAEKNIYSWLNNKYAISKYKRDLTCQRFDDILMESSYGNNATDTINLVLFVAGPIVNFNYPDQVLYSINASLGIQDILISSLKRDTKETRNFFDFGAKGESTLVSKHDGYLMERLGIEPDFYEIDQIYESDKKLRSMQIRLKVDLAIDFCVGDFKKRLSFEKGESLRLWKSWHHSDQDIRDRFSRTGFNTLNMSQSLDNQLNLLISKVKPSDQAI